jgi:hypothetical protein
LTSVYGYTADGGKTFPFRGKGVGLMPTLDEVLAAFPDKPLLINVKSNDPAEGRKLAEYLAKLPKVRRDTQMAYGGGAPIERLQAELSSRCASGSSHHGFAIVGLTGNDGRIGLERCLSDHLSRIEWRAPHDIVSPSITSRCSGVAPPFLCRPLETSLGFHMLPAQYRSTFFRQVRQPSHALRIGAGRR